MDIHADTPLQAFIAFALWQFAEFIHTKKDKHWILGFTGVGFAMLSKGPVGMVIPAFAVVGHILLKKDFRLLLNYRWYLGILLSFVILTPALAGLYNQFGSDGLIFFFWDNNVGRFTGSYIQAINDPLFYVHSLLYLFLPWSLLFFASAYMEFKTLIRNKFKSPEYFTFAGIWIFFIILNASKNQLPNYIFGIMPLIAVLTAKWTDMALTQKEKLLKVYFSIQNSITAILWLAIGFIAFYLFPVSNWQLITISTLAIAATIYIFTNSKSYIPRLILPSAIAFISLIWQLNNDIFPYIFSYQAPPQAARYFTENAKPGETLFNYNYSQYELFFYSEPQAEQLSNDEEMRAVAGNPGNWIFTDSEGFEKIAALNLKPDTVIEYRHLYLNKSIEFIPPKNRENALYPMYLIKY
jgi:4-amino-4-deoxy-L-arabinose transferase-like glycosyltransferase